MPDTTLSQLESHLWEAANILRGPVDAADFKTYVFPLLFFKRISDVHDEEYGGALEESGGDEEYARFPQNYRFQIPEDCHWEDVRTVATNVGAALQSPCARSRLPTPTSSTVSSATRSGPTKIVSPTPCCAILSSTSRRSS
jgi:hypothetical protein